MWIWFSEFIELISKFKRAELLSIWCFSGLSQNKDIDKDSQLYCLLLCVILAIIKILSISMCFLKSEFYANNWDIVMT